MSAAAALESVGLLTLEEGGGGGGASDVVVFVAAAAAPEYAREGAGALIWTLAHCLQTLGVAVGGGELKVSQ